MRLSSLFTDDKEEGILGSILLPSFLISLLSVDDHINRKYAFKVSSTPGVVFGARGGPGRMAIPISIAQGVRIPDCGDGEAETAPAVSPVTAFRRRPGLSDTPTPVRVRVVPAGPAQAGSRRRGVWPVVSLCVPYGGPGTGSRLL